ncbi:MAG: DNA-deoxyinosine glycosylase [Methanomicrobiaceae archaeon]|nr:DNA-deoxyinosine glycosylase [Methanomicrobiaceae archaeon]
MKTKKVAGLKPLVGKKPKVLILGSFPSLISLEKGEYYANKRNSFWKIMCSLFGIDPDLSYEKRADSLLKRRIALWDVIADCSREGSSDSKIKDVVPNDIHGFLRENPTIKCIALNGVSGSGKWFKKIHGDLLEFPEVVVLTLKSTSPANAAFTYDEKISEWAKIMEYTNN